MRYFTLKILLAAVFMLTACNSLTFRERQELASLRYNGVTVDRGPDGWEKPASPLAAGALNLLPGIGNFYLATGEGGDSTHYIYGILNFLTWPASVLWGVPEAAIDAKTINEREMLNFLKYGNAPVEFEVKRPEQRSVVFQ